MRAAAVCGTVFLRWYPGGSPLGFIILDWREDVAEKDPLRRYFCDRRLGSFVLVRRKSSTVCDSVFRRFARVRWCLGGSHLVIVDSPPPTEYGEE